jgi:hypothetical protein
MKPLKKIVAIVFLISLFVVACSVLKKENDQDVQVFITKFQNTLASPDEDILSVFQIPQSRETLLQAIRVLQNKASDVIECNAGFNVATVNRHEEYIEVLVSITISTKNLDNAASEQAVLTMNLVPSGDSYVITKFDAEQLYQAYTSVKNASQWSLEQQAELDKRASVYAMARQLQSSIDTVFWYAKYNGNSYFYGARSWSNDFMEIEGSYGGEVTRMGLYDSLGQVIIPQEYDLIGTIAFDMPDMVEVSVDGQYGYFDIAKRELVIEPVYDMIIPLQKDSIWGVVKRDTIYGWYNMGLQYREGFPSAEIEQYVREVKYLSKEVVLTVGSQVFCEIPNKEFAGYGIVMPPSYLVVHNLFKQIMGGINTTAVPMKGWTDYFGIQKSLMQTINDRFDAVVTVLQERYLGGREEFYGESKVAFLNEHQDLIAVTNIPTDQEIEITAIDNALIQIKANSTGQWFDAPGEESEIPVYSYFKINSEYSLTELKSNRRYVFTEFVKIDSSYLSGAFKKYTGYNEETDVATYDEFDFLTKETIEDIRNEILASYGYRFADERIAKRFDSDWYKPRYDDIAEFEGQMTDIDKHNLDFLERVISYMENASV